MLSRLAVGGLLLEAVEGWRFQVVQGAIVGIAQRANGVLRIAILHPNQLPQPLTHSICLAKACGFADVSWVTPYARKTTETATGPLGSACYHKRQDMVHIWYCLRPAGLVMGAYACPWQAHLSRDERQAVADCEMIVSTAIFDRPAWGADDVLTRFLIAELRRSEGSTRRPSRQRRASSGSRHVRQSWHN
jgi:hypothetical protein